MTGCLFCMFILLWTGVLSRMNASVDQRSSDVGTSCNVSTMSYLRNLKYSLVLAAQTRNNLNYGSSLHLLKEKTDFW